MPFRRRAHRLAPLGLAAAGLLLAAGCSQADDTVAPTSTVASTFPPATVGGTVPRSTTSGTRVSTPTTRRPGSSSTTAASGATTTLDGGPPTTPDGFAQALFEAWRRNDQTAAAVVAEPDAVSSLFAEPFPTTETGDGVEDFYRFRDCSGAAGSTFCTFVGNDSQVQMQVRNQTGGMPMMVIMVKTVDGPAGP